MNFEDDFWRLQIANFTFHFCVAPLRARFMGPTMAPIWRRQDPGEPRVGPHELCYLSAFIESFKMLEITVRERTLLRH